MLPSFKLFRKKWIIISVVTILVITFGYAINARYYYPKLNNDAVQLFIKDKRRIPEQNNSVYSIIGLMHLTIFMTYMCSALIWLMRH